MFADLILNQYIAPPAVMHCWNRELSKQISSTISHLYLRRDWVYQIFILGIPEHACFFADHRRGKQQNKCCICGISFSPVCNIEVPERLTVCYEALMRTGLADRCVSIPVREATDADILLVHRFVLRHSKGSSSDSVWSLYLRLTYFSTSSKIFYMHFAVPNSEEYLEAVKKTPYMTLEELMEFTLQYGDVYFHPVS